MEQETHFYGLSQRIRRKKKFHCALYLEEICMFISAKNMYSTPQRQRFSEIASVSSRSLEGPNIQVLRLLLIAEIRDLV